MEATIRKPKGPELLSFAERKAALRAMAAKGPMAPDAMRRREAWIQTRAQRIIPLITEESYARAIFRPDPLDPDQAPEYDIPPDNERLIAWISQGMGRTPRRQLEGDLLTADTFFIDDAIEIAWKLFKQGRADVVDERIDMLKNSIVRRENLVAFSLILAAVTDPSFDPAQIVEIGAPGDGNVDDATGEGFLSKQLLNLLQTQMDRQRRQPTDVFLSPLSLADIRNWSEVQVDATTRREIFQNNGLGAIWDMVLHKVYGAELVDDETVYLFNRDSFGRMPIRSEVETVEDPTAIRDWKVGVQAREEIGMVITDIRAISVGVVDR